jgi:hypothetical protein
MDDKKARQLVADLFKAEPDHHTARKKGFV